MNKQEALFKYLLRLADNNVVLAQRLCEWTGKGPFLEEDLALTNIALDIFGNGRNLLEYAGRVEGKGRNEDALAFHRNDREYFNFLICEQTNGDYAKTMIRQALFDCFDELLYAQLCKSKDETIAGIAGKAVKEIIYHKRHSFSWVERFGKGTQESKMRAQEALNELWRFTNEFFEKDETEEMMIKEGIAADPASLKAEWEKQIKALFEKSDLQIPSEIFMQTGGRKGVHSEKLGFLLSEMQALPRMYPTAKW